MLVWGVGALAYVMTVAARTSLSATGVDAALRFGASASVLSLFTVLQLAVYAAMQIPAGAVLDRLGARRAIVIGSVLVAAGQLAIAFAGSVPTAIGARVLIGSGDAFVFISVVRLVPMWFPPRRVPLFTQVTGMTGQLGQLLSLGPLVGLVHARGWTSAFIASGSASLLVAALVLLLVRDASTRGVVVFEDDSTGPAPALPGEPAVGAAPTRPDTSADAPQVGRPEGRLLSTWRNPGTREGFWVHFVSPMSANAFVMLWGFAYMTRAELLPDATALAVLSTYVLGCMIASPVLGLAASRFSGHRAELVTALVGIQVLVWAVVLLWPGPAPAALFFVLALSLGVGGPASLIGFDICRAANPLSSLGLATGMVNTGGFISTLTAILGVGVVLDLLGQSSPDQFTDAGFAIAWLVQVPVWALGIAMVFRSRAQSRRAGLPE